MIDHDRPSARVTSTLPVPPDAVHGLMVKPALLRYVTWPILIVRGLPETFTPDRPMTARLSLFGVVPLWEHTIKVVAARAGEVRTEEHGGPSRAWRHRLLVTPVSPSSCQYTDEVVIETDRLAPLARRLATLFYRYRHWRWRSLARVLS